MKQVGARLAKWMLTFRGRACPRPLARSASGTRVIHTCASRGRVVCMDVWNPASQWIPERFPVLTYLPCLQESGCVRLVTWVL